MKKYTAIIILGVLAVGGASAWYFGFRKKAVPLVLETVHPQRGYISTSITATGTIQPVDTVTVGSQVSGTIKAIYVDFNDRVRKGQLIAELDKSLFLATVNQYGANLELARSNLSYQESNFTREKLLFDSLVVSRSEFENAKYLYESAKATVNSVQAQLDGAKQNLSYANIYSPVDGVVLFRNIGIGQTVAASFNTPTLFIIARDITKMQVQAAVDEADIGNVKKGLWANFTVDAYPDITFSGLVREIRLQPVVSANVVTYTTLIDAPNKDQKLKPGMTANIFIYTREDSNALLIPSKALRFSPDSSLKKQFKILAAGKNKDGKMETSGQQLAINPSAGNNHNNTNPESMGAVWVETGDSLTEKPVHTGINDDTHVQVLDGLNDYDLVVLGVTNSSTKATPAGAPKSPFMPTRRTTPAPKKKTAGSN